MAHLARRRKGLRPITDMGREVQASWTQLKLIERDNQFLYDCQEQECERMLPGESSEVVSHGSPDRTLACHGQRHALPGARRAARREPV